jgi:alcohol dehydrogenase class IV
MRFEFGTASRIVFGPGTLLEIGKIAAGFGDRILVFTGSGGASPEKLLASLEKEGLSYELQAVMGEPTVPQIEDHVQRARTGQFSAVIGLGGGSVIDTGKAVAALLANPGDVMDYLEIVGKNQPLMNPPIPYIAIPTTAGTGSEVTRNAVLGVPGKKVKVSLRGALLLPRVALVDPELTLSAPPAVSASTGMDALTQLIEPYVSARRNPLVDVYCKEGMQRAARSLLAVYRDGSNLPAREDMAFASLLGGLSLANAGLGAVHGFAGPIGGMFDAQHGAICARLLPLVVKENIQALQDREPDSPVLDRYAEIGQILTGDRLASMQDGALWIEALTQSLQIPPLSVYGIRAEDIDEIVEKSSVASSMQANPIRLTKAELKSILTNAL